MNEMSRTTSILDPIRDTLPTALWDKAGSFKPLLKPRVAHWIKRNVYSALEQAGYTNPERWLTLVVTGSTTTYQYGPDSDLDVSLFIDSRPFPEWSRAEMIAVMVDQLDDHTVPGTPFPLQCYVVPHGIDPHDLYKPGVRSGYNLDNNKWIVPPERSRSHDVEAEYKWLYIHALQVADKMERLLHFEPKKAVDFYHSLHDRRKRDMQKGLGDYSQSNVIFKFLAHRGLLPKLTTISAPQENRQSEDISWRDRYRESDLPSDFEDWNEEKQNEWMDEHGQEIPQWLQMTGHFFPGRESSWTLVGSSLHELIERVYQGIMSGGIIVNLAGEEPTERYGFAPGKASEERIPLEDVSPAHIEEYIQQHLTELSQPGKYLGTWISAGDVWFDVTEGHDDYVTAYERAWKGHQQAMYDSVTGEDIPVRGMDYEPSVGLDSEQEHRESMAHPIYYHVSPREVRSQIEQEGLRVPENSEWFDPDDPGMIWLHGDEAAARKWAGPNDDIWQVYAPDAEPGGSHSFATRAPIPPDRIRRI